MKNHALCLLAGLFAACASQPDAPKSNAESIPDPALVSTDPPEGIPGVTSVEPDYGSSVVGTDFDYITEGDPSVFEQLVFLELGPQEMPDKSEGGELFQQAFAFEASFADGSRVQIHLDADFESQAAAQAEAMRYVQRLGRLPSALLHGVNRLVVHMGKPDTTAFSDIGLIVVYSANATKRISTHDLEETLFHESVHAAWDAKHARSPEWLAAQDSDGGFVTRYAQKNPKSEDLAESALFAYTLIHNPERIPEPDAARIRATIPARIAFVKGLIPTGRPIHFQK